MSFPDVFPSEVLRKTHIPLQGLPLAGALCDTPSTIQSGRRHSRISADFPFPIPAEILFRNSDISAGDVSGFAALPAAFGGGTLSGTDRCRTAANAPARNLSAPQRPRMPDKCLPALHSAFWRCYTDAGRRCCRISAV